MTVPSPGLICALLATIEPVALAPQTDWLAEPAVQQRLAEGEVVVEGAGTIDLAAPRGRVRAAVRIPAPPEVVWSVMTDCAQAPHFVPGLKRCRRIDGASDGSWQDIEQEVRYSWFLPAVRYVFRAQYDRPHRVDFHRISGDLKEEEGTWLLIQAADGSATLVEYEVYVDPGFWVPQGLVIRMLRKDVPAVLSGLRTRIEETGRATK